MGGAHRAQRSPRPGPIASRRASREHRRQPRHGPALQRQSIRANGATHAQQPPASLPSRGQSHESGGARPSQIARATHGQPASPFENRTQIKHGNPQVKARPASRARQKTLCGRHQTQPPRQQRATSGGGGQPRGQLDFYDRPGRKADERARREHRARPRGLNPRPATDRPSGHRQPSGGGHITHRPEHAGGRGRLTRPRRAPGPDRPGSGMQARHHAPVKPRRHREKARSERGRNRHGTPPRQASRREAARPLGPPGPAPRASPRYL